jgi:hypothetical protein
MTLSGPILVETPHVNETNLGGFLNQLQGCWKSTTLLWMQCNYFPVLPGLILSGWDHQSEKVVSRFCKERDFSALLVRMEKPGQRWTHRRGGYTLPLGQIPSAVKTLADEGLITILLEPASPYSDSYSVTSVSDVDAGKIDIEVVGPGFDASDVLRADITPHERLQATVDVRSQSAWDRSRVQLRRTYLIDHESYRRSVTRRLSKIGAKLRNPAFPDEWLEPSVPNSSVDSLVREATRYLEESRQTVLLEHADRYEPIPDQLLDTFLSQLLRLSKSVAESTVPWRTFSLAASFLARDRLVIWDFFPPGDPDTATLASLKG